MTIEEFINKYLGKQVEYHSYDPTARYQCVDLVNFFWNSNGLTTVIGTNAKDFPTKVNKDQFEVIKNTPDFIPIAGDIAVWNGRVGGGAGHVAIVRDNKANKNTFNSVDQNWSKKELVTLETHNYNNVSYFIRAKEAQVTDEYKGLDLNNKASMMVAVDAWFDITKGDYEKVKKTDLEELRKNESQVKVLNERIKQERLANEASLETQKNELNQQCDLRVNEAKDRLLKENSNLKEQISNLEKSKPISVNDLLQRFTSRKFLIALTAFVIVILDATMKLDISPIILTGANSIIIAYLGIEGYTDYKERVK